MQQSYLSLSTQALLSEFGAGKDVPGSGSAAALNGLLAAQLIVTVCKITLRTDAYKKSHVSMKRICTRIESVLIPELEKLLDEDSATFHEANAERIARDKALDQESRERHAAAATELLKPATALPFKIAKHCIELIDHAAIVFKDGAKRVRGDTGVALSTAFSGVLSCVFIINLNLKSFKQNAWALQRRKECDQLQRDATTKYQLLMSQLSELRTEVNAAVTPVAGTEPVLALLGRAKQNYTIQEIEDRARKLSLFMWEQQKRLTDSSAPPANPIRLLDPEKALGLLGYSFELADTLGTKTSNGTTLEVAGILEAQLGRVRVSRQMPAEIRLFTSAHELGHVVLHPQLQEAHRDRALDGSDVSKDQIEREADRFAAAFLMPAKQVRTRFSQTFGSAPFRLTEPTAFALLGKGLPEARQKLKTYRDLSLELARTQRFNGKNIISLAEQFRVSVSAMAIRLEELELL